LKDFDRAEFESRWTRMRELMRASSIDALLVTTQSNYRYLCGHRSVQFAIGARPMILVLPLDSDPVLLIPGGEVSEALAQTWIEDVRGYTGLPLEAAAVPATLRDLGLDRARFGCELGPWQRLGIPHSMFEAIREGLPAARFVDASAVLEAVRMVKSEAEIARIEAACKVAAVAYQLVEGRVRPGLSVAEGEDICMRAMLEAGADMDERHVVSFPSFPKHHVFAAGDLFQIDFALALRGYRADLTRRATFGSPSAAQQRDHDQISAIQKMVISAMRPGASARSIALLFNAQAAGLGHPGLGGGGWIGHGIGLDLLERPSLNETDATRLQAGMVLTPEPWFVRDGRVVMAEETVLITDSGSRILTQPAQQELRSL
jgi:Xaa-Pro aminopeptidase